MWLKQSESRTKELTFDVGPGSATPISYLQETMEEGVNPDELERIVNPFYVTDIAQDPTLQQPIDTEAVTERMYKNLFEDNIIPDELEIKAQNEFKKYLKDNPSLLEQSSEEDIYSQWEQNYIDELKAEITKSLNAEPAPSDVNVEDTESLLESALGRKEDILRAMNDATTKEEQAELIQALLNVKKEIENLNK